MKRIFTSLALAVIAMNAEAVQARIGDAQWAACAWQTDRQAATNWIKLVPTIWSDKFGSPSELLGLRLLATCDGTPADPAKPNRIRNWKSAQQQLKKSQPREMLTSAPSAVQARLCEYFSVKDGQRAMYRVEVERVAAASSTLVDQIYFDQAGSNAIKIVDRADRRVSFQFNGTPKLGSAIRMPQDVLIASPSEGYASEKACYLISDTGNLVDA